MKRFAYLQAETLGAASRHLAGAKHAVAKSGGTDLLDLLKERIVEADSGGGLVKAFTNGNGELVKLTISPEAIDPDDLGMLEDLVVAAVLKSQEVANELQQTEMNKVTGGLSLPGLF